MDSKLSFNCFKNKTIALSYSIVPDSLNQILKEIYNKKLFKCFIKYDSIECLINKFEEITFKGHTDGVGRLLRLSKSEVISIGFDGFIKIWDLSTGHCKRTDNMNDIKDCLYMGKYKVYFIKPNSNEEPMQSIEITYQKILSGFYNIIKLNKTQVAFKGECSILIWDIKRMNA